MTLTAQIFETENSYSVWELLKDYTKAQAKEGVEINLIIVVSLAFGVIVQLVLIIIISMVKLFRRCNNEDKLRT